MCITKHEQNLKINRRKEQKKKWRKPEEVKKFCEEQRLLLFCLIQFPSDGRSTRRKFVVSDKEQWPIEWTAF